MRYRLVTDKMSIPKGTVFELEANVTALVYSPADDKWWIGLDALSSYPDHWFEEVSDHEYEPGEWIIAGGGFPIRIDHISEGGHYQCQVFNPQLPDDNLTPVSPVSVKRLATDDEIEGRLLEIVRDRGLFDDRFRSIGGLEVVMDTGSTDTYYDAELDVLIARDRSDAFKVYLYKQGEFATLLEEPTEINIGTAEECECNEQVQFEFENLDKVQAGTRYDVILRPIEE